MRTIGFFGGSFDPIHFGHISLAIQLLESHGLDEVLFCPAFCSPFKTDAPPVASPQHRLALLRLALEGIPHFRIITLEIDRGGPSYTIDTLRSLKGKMRLLLSDDAAARLNLWKETEELKRIAPPLIGERKMREISSTEIRARLRKGLYCGHLVPARSLDYIHAHRLYSGA